MTTSWDEIKRLAADFQRVQLVESSYKLSERNCIEIISKLIELGMLNVIHSIDGKEYVTFKQIEKEIYDELYVHEGRINIVELQTLLNIDVSYIESKVSEIVKNDPNLFFILGQIISKDYMNKMAEEVNELLQDRQSLNVAELTNMYELPGDFVQQIIKPRIGTIIKGNFDGKILYTHNYVNTQKSLLSGVLEASIKPIRFAQIVKGFNLDSSLIFENYDDLISSGHIKGSLLGGRQVTSALFVPAIFTKAQQQYVCSFFKQNGYIEYSLLKKIGITEPDSYARSVLSGENKYLASSCYADYFLDQIEQEIDELINKNGFCDVAQLVPSALTEKDINALSAHFESKMRSSIDAILMADTYLIRKEFLKSLQTKFHAKMEQKAQEDLTKRNIVLAIRTEHAYVGGFSNQSNTNTSQEKAQTKSKAKSKKGEKATVIEQQQDETMIEIVFIDKTGLVKELKQMINDASDELIDAVVEYFLRLLNAQYFELLKNKIETGLQSTSNKSQSETESSSSNTSTFKPQALDASKKLIIKDVQEKVKLFLVNAKIFEKSMKLFGDPKVQDLLSKHLLKTVCSEITNQMLKVLAEEQMIQINDENLNTETRSKLIQKLKEPHKKLFTELNQSMTNKTFSEVIELIEKVATDSLELSMKKDTKREKETILQLRESTKAALECESDPATVLHLVSTLIFYHVTGLMLNAPGRCVPNILEFLKSSLQEDIHSKLVYFQNKYMNYFDLVLKDVIIENLSKSKSNKDENESSNIIDSNLVNEIKNIGLNGKNYVINKEK